MLQKMLEFNSEFVGIDNINDYYDLNLKKSRLDFLKNLTVLTLKNRYSELLKLNELFEKNNFDHVIHLAAQAGVRYSIKNPQHTVIPM